MNAQWRISEALGVSGSAAYLDAKYDDSLYRFGLRKAEGLASSRGLSLELASRCAAEDRIYTYGTFLHGIPFYTRHLVDKTVNWTGELHYAKRNPANAHRFGDDNDIRALPERGRKTFVVLRRFEAPYFLTLTTPDKLKSWKAFGNWVLAEF